MWVPPSAVREVREETAAHRAEALAALVLAEEMREYEKELHDIDDTLMLRWAREDVDIVGLTPGRFHLIRDNGALPPTLVPIEDEDGGFLPLGSHVYDLVRKMDLWNDQVTKARRQREKKVFDAEERQKAREKQERIEEANERYKAMVSPGISMTGQGEGWKFRAAARRAK